ncbi:cupin-like domain-containing protein [Cystobacter fuscus]|uniref:cupin-like domain-containing protein n=1 Tax=Cystobacter fuscus TaxID=43 RepID=UPI002B2E1D3D|nr:cupin-like domain-containing protein [Cystobacter fuscus]
MSIPRLSLTRPEYSLNLSPIERRSGVSVADFERLYRHPQQPIVLTDGVAEWPALTEWTFEYFKKAHGSHPVTVYFARGGPYLDNLHSSQPRTVTVAEYLALIEQQPDCRVYLGESSILDELPRLADAAPAPRYLPTDRFMTRRFWLGPANTLTAIHKDSIVQVLPICTLFAQIRGHKQFVLAAPDQAPFLYPSPKDPNASLVDPEHLDLEKFPLLRQARFQETVLGPGELLLIPGGWWHLVHALEPCISISNDWVEDPLADMVTRILKTPDPTPMLEAYRETVTREQIEAGFPGGVSGVAAALTALPEDARPLVATLFTAELREAVRQASTA